MPDELKAILTRFAVTMVLSFLLYVVQHLVEHGWWKSLTAAMDQRDEYESEIAKHVVRSASISERLDDIGGLRHVKEDIKAQVLLPLSDSDAPRTTHRTSLLVAACCCWLSSGPCRALGDVPGRHHQDSKAG